MKAPAFAYARPSSLPDALELMERHGEEARALAGGQSLVPLLAMRLARPGVLVDLNRIPELAGTEVGRDRVRIGALTRLAELERNSAVAEALPILRAALGHVGHFQIRNRSTFGGCLAHADPAAEVPALAVLLGATVVLRSARGERTLPAADFILGPFTTAAEPGELLTAVELPRPDGAGWAFTEVARREGDFALVGAAALQPAEGPARVVVFGAGPVPQVVSGSAPEIEARSDIHASAAYRRTVGARLATRVASEAAERREELNA